MYLLKLALVLTSLAFAAEKPLTVTLMDAHGKEVGTATLTAAKKGVKVHATLHDLTPGEHAFHIHENGKCEGPDFKSAGGHFSPGHHAHGKVENGPHEGDMPNVKIGKDGKGHAMFTAENVSLTPESLLKEGGTALVVHAKEDDYKSQPAGNAGDRVACGIIKR
jgi:Cu-Zn family superoxide dismutase